MERYEDYFDVDPNIDSIIKLLPECPTTNDTSQWTPKEKSAVHKLSKLYFTTNSDSPGEDAKRELLISYFVCKAKSRSLSDSTDNPSIEGIESEIDRITSFINTLRNIYRITRLLVKAPKSAARSQWTSKEKVTVRLLTDWYWHMIYCTGKGGDAEWELLSPYFLNNDGKFTTRFRPLPESTVATE